ncbi:HNH endonuclease [Colwellia sp. Arc7-635]|uniref:HNH endonuclease signature motif containing protein n=1 Tax=Colwellia sp. Arc7-635 TaxID=2497879 RepID=UPI000F851204|nr:HNH endonuclease signature motif containing protein [Colwellia sp. Arc7-635]AZQ84262.1 HNH endonuclease [Colwellia sp. Arc7-635]
MKLTVNFAQLHHCVQLMGAEEADFELGLAFKDIDPIDAALRDGQELGKDIDLIDIEHTKGVLSYKGRQIMLYIPDQGSNIRNVIQDGKQGRRIHIAECSTLQQMRETGRFPRYQVTNEMSGYVPVYGVDSDTYQGVEDKAHLGTCMNCLRILNYQGYLLKGKLERHSIFEKFSFINFFETYSSYFKSLPVSGQSKGLTTYSSDWSSISSTMKNKVNYMCEQCGVDLDTEKKLLHVHHIDGVKSNNKSSNLRVLCADCHKKQPHHEHLFIKAGDVLSINRLRREQHKFDNTTYNQLIGCADTALEGLLLKCQSSRLPITELGIAVMYEHISVQFDLCWPRKKVAVLIDMKNATLVKNHGWTVFSASQALEKFQDFQRYIR